MSAGKNTASHGSGRARPVPALIPMAVSVRHVHLTQRTVEQLFGPAICCGFARCCRNRAIRGGGNRRVVGRGSLEHVRIVGPPVRRSGGAVAHGRDRTRDRRPLRDRAIWRAPRASSSKDHAAGDAAAWRHLRPAAHPYEPGGRGCARVEECDKVAAVVTTGTARWSSATLS